MVAESVGQTGAFRSLGDIDSTRNVMPDPATRPGPAKPWRRRLEPRLMVKTLALFVAASVVAYLLLPTAEGVTVETGREVRVVATTDPWPPNGSWPSPQQPFDETPITPFETVCGESYEP